MAVIFYLRKTFSYQQFSFFTFSISETLVRATIISSDNFTMLNLLKTFLLSTFSQYIATCKSTRDCHTQIFLSCVVIQSFICGSQVVSEAR